MVGRNHRLETAGRQSLALCPGGSLGRTPEGIAHIPDYMGEAHNRDTLPYRPMASMRLRRDAVSRLLSHAARAHTRLSSLVTA